MTILVQLPNQQVKIDFKQFSGGERHVQLNQNILENLDKTVKVHAELNNSNDIFDYLLLENVLLQYNKNIDLEIPYFPYARQDRICADGQAFSLDMMTKLLNINHINHENIQRNIIVWDAHSSVTETLLKQNSGFKQVLNVNSIEIISRSQTLSQILSEDNTVLICPDHGAEKRTAEIAGYFNTYRTNNIEIIHSEKSRDPKTGKILNSMVKGHDLTTKTAVITDDICDGGATFIGIAKQLRAMGCGKIILYVTHGIFSRGLDVFDGLVDQIFTSNSKPQSVHSKLNIIEYSKLS